jgi:hypothetical protein
VAWPVIVAATTNYVLHNGNHTCSIAPQAATVVVASCGVLLPIGSSMPQDATTTVVACGLRISLAALYAFSLIFNCAYLSLFAMNIGSSHHN